jgi:hypothetical protein
MLLAQGPLSIISSKGAGILANFLCVFSIKAASGYYSMKIKTW